MFAVAELFKARLTFLVTAPSLVLPRFYRLEALFLQDFFKLILEGIQILG